MGDEVRRRARRGACAQSGRVKALFIFCSRKRERDVKKQKKDWLSLFSESVVFCMCSFFLSVFFPHPT